MILRVPKAKLTTLILVGLLLAAVVGYFFGNFIANQNLLFLLGTAVAVTVYLAFFLVRVLLINKWRLSLTLITAEVLIIDLFLLKSPLIWLLGATIITVALLFIAYWRGQAGINNTIKIHFHDIQHIVLSTAIFGLILFGTIIYLSSINIENMYVEKKPILYVIQLNESIINKLLPGFSTKISFNDLVQMLLKKTNQQLPLEDIDLGVANVNQQISRLAGINIHSQKNIIDVLQEIINGLLVKVPEQLKILIVIGLGIIIFFTINGGTFIFIWIIGFLTWLIYKLILTTNFAHISLEKSQKETISLE